MGGNSPSQFAHEGDGEAGGVSFVTGIRLSDRVVNRLKESRKVIRTRPSDNAQQPPSHSGPEPVATVATAPAPSAEHVSTPPDCPMTPPFPSLPTQEPTPASTPPLAHPVKITSPPPVKFHSPPPPPVVHQEPKKETVTDPVALTTPLPSPVAEPNATAKPLPETVLPILGEPVAHPIPPPQSETARPTLVEPVIQSVAPPKTETAFPALVEPIAQSIPPLKIETALPKLVEPISQSTPPQSETALPTLVEPMAQSTPPPQTETVIPTLVEPIAQSTPPSQTETVIPTLVEPIAQSTPPPQTETVVPTLVEPVAQSTPPPQTETVVPTLVEPVAQSTPPPQTETVVPTLVEPVAQFTPPPQAEPAFSTLAEPKVLLSAPIEPPPPASPAEAVIATSSPPVPQTLQQSAIPQEPPIPLPVPVEVVTPPSDVSAPAETINVAPSVALSVEDNITVAPTINAPSIALSMEDITVAPVLSLELLCPSSPAVMEIGHPADPPLLCHSMEVSLQAPGSAEADPPAETIDLAPPPLDAEPEVPDSTPLPVSEDPFPVFIVRPLPVAAVPVDEEELRRKIKEELQGRLAEDIHQRKLELQLQLEEVTARARAEAREEAQVEIQAQVKRTLEAERSEHAEQLRNALLTERMKSEDERLIAQVYAHKLDEKERALKELDGRFREHLAKLEEKRSQFYKVSAENHKRGREETHSRFARYSISPACADLQGQVMNCYRDNTGQTLACSPIAAAYMQCVADAKLQNKLITGG